MNELATDPNAFIRPSPSGNFLGGVAQRTRESIFLCEAAGYDVIIVETVGVGQSETSVKNMVDFFLLLVIVGSGDELQGIKRGIMEMADMILINKIDDENDPVAKRTANEFKQALHLFPPKPNNWIVPVNTVSSIKRRGIKEAWNEIQKFRILTEQNSTFLENRVNQNIEWFKEAIQSKLISDFYSKPGIKEEIASLNVGISKDQISIRNAINRLFEK
jgi:LAO/AO transport system kinase